MKGEGDCIVAVLLLFFDMILIIIFHVRCQDDLCHFYTAELLTPASTYGAGYFTSKHAKLNLCWNNVGEGGPTLNHYLIFTEYMFRK